MKRPQEITMKLKKCNHELKDYIVELEKINLKLHKEKAKLQAQNVDYQNEIKALKKQPPSAKIIIKKFSDDHIKDLSNEEIEKKIKELNQEIKSRHNPTQPSH